MENVVEFAEVVNKSDHVRVTTLHLLMVVYHVLNQITAVKGQRRNQLLVTVI